MIFWNKICRNAMHVGSWTFKCWIESSWIWLYLTLWHIFPMSTLHLESSQQTPTHTHTLAWTKKTHTIPKSPQINNLLKYIAINTWTLWSRFPNLKHPGLLRGIRKTSRLCDPSRGHYTTNPNNLHCCKGKSLKINICISGSPSKMDPT